MYVYVYLWGNSWTNSCLMNFSCSNIISLSKPMVLFYLSVPHYTVLRSSQCKAAQTMPSGDSIASKGCGSLPTDLSNWLPCCCPNLPRCQLCFTSIAEGHVDQISLFKFMVASIVQASLLVLHCPALQHRTAGPAKHGHGMTDYDTI